MSIDKSNCSFVEACRDFFNDRPVSLDELKALTADDRTELKSMLKGVGYNIASKSK